MELSFRVKACLGFSVIVLGVLSIAYSYLGIIIGAIGVILLYCEIKDHIMEKADFRKKIIHESLDILGFILDPNTSHIPHGDWNSRPDESKPDLLGNREYVLWKRFYDGIDARNKHFREHGLGLSCDFEKVNDECIRSILRIHADIPWVKKCEEAETRIAAFVEVAKDLSGISESLRSELV